LKLFTGLGTKTFRAELAKKLNTFFFFMEWKEQAVLRNVADDIIILASGDWMLNLKKGAQVMLCRPETASVVKMIESTLRRSESQVLI